MRIVQQRWYSYAIKQRNQKMSVHFSARLNFKYLEIINNNELLVKIPINSEQYVASVSIKLKMCVVAEKKYQNWTIIEDKNRKNQIVLQKRLLYCLAQEQRLKIVQKKIFSKTSVLVFWNNDTVSL